MAEAMPDPYQVREHGRDSSGRPILMNNRMWAAFQAANKRSGVTPTIVQGAYMSRLGGGADASAGTHNRGGALDLRTWDLTSRQRRRWMRAAKIVGWAPWFRTAADGFDEHMHVVLLGDQEATDDTMWQMGEYKAGRNGLTNRNRDRTPWRPSPIPTFNYAAWFKNHSQPREWDEMASKAEVREVIDNALAAERPKIVAQVVNQVTSELNADLFPDEKDRNSTLRGAVARILTWVQRQPNVVASQVSVDSKSSQVSVDTLARDEAERHS